MRLSVVVAVLGTFPEELGWVLPGEGHPNPKGDCTPLLFLVRFGVAALITFLNRDFATV